MLPTSKIQHPRLRPVLRLPSLRLIVAATFGILLTLAPIVAAQAQPPSAAVNPARITQPVDDTVLTTLKGNVHPLARAQYDQGAASPSLPMKRILMVLKRSDTQESLLRNLLDQQQDKHSAIYRQWLTPTQLGEQYGPAAGDIKNISTWLQSQGFTVDHISKSGLFVEFSGTAGQVASAFHTEIHSYLVNGERHYANVSDPQIPSALAPVIAGFVSLNNFPRKPLSRLAGEFQREKSSGKVTPIADSSAASKSLFTYTDGNGNTNYAVGPYDLATIYNILPLWNASSPLDGTGQTIAIAGRTNINPQDAYDFRTLFGLPTGGSLAAFQQSYLNIILNGPDPGNLQGGEEGEANIDVQWSGAVAKGALIDFVVSQSTTTSDGADLSAEYIIDNNLAPVMSYSFGSCELALGTGGNTFFQLLWEQAAAQGISAFVAAGDAGSAGCDQNQTTAQFGFEVSGNASTPFNVAVGGTDFDQLQNNPANFWNPTNNSITQASAKGYIPETTWNNSCTNSVYSIVTNSPDPLTNCNDSSVIQNYGGLQVGGGGGGPSTCISSTNDNPATCVGGYPKPAWQVGTISDNVRDLPDISLFASNGFAGSFYIICQSDTNASGTCDLNSPYMDFAGYGGTSVASPAVAGVFGILNQKIGTRVGNPNYALYNLASKQAASSCNSTNGPGSSCIFNDVTSGTISQPCTSGTFNCYLTSADTYGVVVSDNGSGYGHTDASGYPSDLAWNTAVGYDYATGLGSLNVSNLVNNWTTANFLASTTTLSLSTTTFTHGSTTNASVKVTSNTGTPSGDVSFNGPVPNGSIGYATLSGGAASVPLNSLPGGSYNVVAHYGGNNDGTHIYAGSNSNPVAVAISPEGSSTALTTYLINPTNNTLTQVSSAVYGSELVTRAQVSAASGNGVATGSVAITANGTALSGSPFKLNSEGNAEDQFFSIDAGTYAFVGSYSGDPSFNPNTGNASLAITQATPVSTLNSSAASVPAGTSVTLSTVLDTTTYVGKAPTGTVTFYAGTTALGSPVSVTAGSDSNGFPEATAALATTTIPAGTNTITAKYSGDVNYAPVTSPSVTVTVTGAVSPGKFALTNTAATVTSPGQSGTSTITVTPSGGYTGTVNLTCALTTSPSGANATYNPTCSLAASSVKIASAAGTDTATFATTAPTTGALVYPKTNHWYTAAGGAALACMLFFGIPARRRGWRSMLSLLVFLVATAGVGCGGGGNNKNPGTPGTTTGTYTFTVTGTDSVTSSNAGTTVVTVTVN
jgi:hypothetical protein